ncbi:uncharacterized protein LOC125518346 [Triticum urartu]|uniref:Uncharacterized protein n=1 Tax=Triticum urartu TaxID=4572 RepID=A0A8R7UYK5_TRIUA|nr:uncharacterized protein LOC125518346 [Triticum urartu]
MAPPPLDDLTHLLTEVASRLARPPGGSPGPSSAGDPLSASVSSLAAALNPRAAAPASSGTRVLDAALSLMCFDPQEVDRARLGCLVRTAVSALSDSASCRVARTDDRAEMLCVGGPPSPPDRELVRSCAALVEKLGGRDVAGHSYDLLHAAVKTALLSPRYQCLFPSPYYREDGESSCEMGTISLDVTTHPSYQVLPNDGSIPPRVHLWHYDPSILEHDLSEMLREAITRPLLCLRKELHDRVAWRVIVICLVCSPLAFLEMRSLFHIWFLATGMGSVLGLCTAVVSSVLDILLEPTGWGISMELGQKFPFTHAYFPSQQRDLLAILTGPISCRRFLDLVSYIEAMVFLGKTNSDNCSWKNIQSQPSKGSHLGKKQPSKGLVKFKYSSAWLTITNFPTWFSFATALLFHQEGSQGYLSEVLSEEKTAESISDINLAQRAAFYLSWVLCPFNVDECQMLANNMVELSHYWARNNKKRPSNPHHSSTVNHRRRLRVPTVGDTEKFNVSTNLVSSLIKDFDDRCVKFCRITAVSQVQGAEQLDIPLSCPNFLHLRIPLGVLLVSSACISEQDCNVLLHYASTGLVMESKEGQTKRKDQAGNDVFSSSRGGSTERWALSGACLIFGWLDIIEDMSAVIFECEDTCCHFVSQLRTKTGPYLLKCVNLLLNEAGHDKDFVIDLRDRLLNWTKGQRFDGCEAFKDVIVQMNAKIQPSS